MDNERSLENFVPGCFNSFFLPVIQLLFSSYCKLDCTIYLDMAVI